MEIEILDQKDMEGNLVEILPRKNELFRPAVANIDQALVLFALESPKPNAALLDRFLIMMEKENIPVFICFNKEDLAGQRKPGNGELSTRTAVIRSSLPARVRAGDGNNPGKAEGKNYRSSGPSGAGKSTVANQMQSLIAMETGEISRKLKRGRHTTRHSQLIPVEEDTYICDTRALLLSIRRRWTKKNCGSSFRSSVLWRENAGFRDASTSMSRTAR